MKGKLSKIRPQGHRAKSRTSEYHCHDRPNERAGLLWQAQSLRPLLLKIESTVPKHFHLEAIGFSVLAKLLRTRKQRLSSHDAKWFLLPWHAIILYTAPVELNGLPISSTLGRTPWQKQTSNWFTILDSLSHTHEKLFLTGLFSAVAFSWHKCQMLWQVTSPSLWWPWVLALVNQYISVITRMPKLKGRVY